MKINIKFEDGEKKEVEHHGDFTFPQWVKDFFSARYYVLSNSNEKGNLAIDTQKVKYVELQ